MSEPANEVLIRIDENVKHLRDIAVPEIKEWQGDHAKQDDERFGKLNKSVDTMSGSYSTLLWFMGGIGVLVAGVIIAFVQHVMSGK